MQDNTRTVTRLAQKSREAFLLAIELYNRPTIRYHVEGCAFFLCNAWELMLKAHLIQRDGMDTIYYPGSERTLSLEDCLRRVFTNSSDPLRRNMDKVIELRNTSTHFIIPEYETFYAPLLQSCVENYDEQLSRLLGIEIGDDIPENYLMLSVRRKDVDEDECRALYDPIVLDKMLERMEGIKTAADELESRRFSCVYVTELRVTKRKDADHTFRIAKDGEQPVTMMKALVQAKDKYPYRPGMVVREICQRIKREGLTLMQGGEDTCARTKGGKPFNLYMFGLFTSFYDMKGDGRYSYDAAMEGEQPSYIYSQQAVDLIWDKIKESPEGVIDWLRKAIAAKKKPTPGAREF